MVEPLDDEQYDPFLYGRDNDTGSGGYVKTGILGGTGGPRCEFGYLPDGMNCVPDLGNTNYDTHQDVRDIGTNVQTTNVQQTAPGTIFGMSPVVAIGLGIGALFLFSGGGKSKQ